MEFLEIKNLIQLKFGDDVVLAANEKGIQPILTINLPNIDHVCSFLQSSSQTYFDMLSCLTAIDNGPAVGTMEVVYNLYSIPYGYKLALKVEFDREKEEGKLPEIPTVSHIWRTADWHEREAHDLFGINFIGHPDQRRILLPADWHGYPLRKDYSLQAYYHGIKVKY